MSPSIANLIKGKEAAMPETHNDVIRLCFWRVHEGKPPGVGKMLRYACSLHDDTFETNWEMAN